MEAPKPSQLKRYIYEYALIALSVCVGYLFFLYIDLSNYVRKELSEQTIQTRITLSENSAILREVIFLIKQKQQSNEKSIRLTPDNSGRLRIFKPRNTVEKKSQPFEQNLYRTENYFRFFKQGKTLQAIQPWPTTLNCVHFACRVSFLFSAESNLQSGPYYPGCVYNSRRLYANR